MTEPVRNKAETDPVQIAADFFQATYGPNPPLITFIRSPRRDDRNKIIPSFFCRSTPSRDVLERVLAEGAKGTTEMFFRVAPMSRDGQPGEEAALPCAVAWAEVDHGLSDHDRDFLGSVDATIIESGGVDVRGGAKTHLYVPLDAPHPPHVVKQLNTLLRGRLGGDNAQSLAKMLRVPGTYHRKDPDNPRPVVVRRLSGGGGTSPETLATVLGAVVTHAAPPILDHVLTPQRPAVSNMEAHAALVSVNARDERGEITNRDAALWGLYKDVVRAGITDPTEILWYALRCKVNKHHDAWLAGDVARFFVHKDYRRALSERPGAAKPMILDFTNVGDAAPDDYSTPTEQPERVSRFLTRAQLRDRPEPKWLVERLIPEYGIGQLFGPTYSGKTYAAIDLSMRLCAGMSDWLDHKINSAGPVFYVLMEGAFDFPQRLDAWESCYGAREVAPLYTMCEEELNLADDDSLDRLAEDIEAVSDTRHLLVIDTQSLAIRGVVENDTSGMNEVMINLKRLSRRLHCFVLLVHHTGHAVTDRARGASTQDAAMDLIVGIKSGDKGRKVFVPKVKAGREDLTGKDFILREQPNGWPAFARMTTEEKVDEFKAALARTEQILTFIRQHDGRVVSPEELKTKFKLPVGATTEAKSAWKSMRRDLDVLTNEGKILNVGKTSNRPMWIAAP